MFNGKQPKPGVTRLCSKSGGRRQDGTNKNRRTGRPPPNLWPCAPGASAGTRARYALKRFLPFKRLRFNTLRPSVVFMRLRKPCTLLRCLFLGWYVMNIALHLFSMDGKPGELTRCSILPGKYSQYMEQTPHLWAVSPIACISIVEKRPSCQAFYPSQNMRETGVPLRAAPERRQKKSVRVQNVCAYSNMSNLKRGVHRLRAFQNVTAISH